MARDRRRGDRFLANKHRRRQGKTNGENSVKFFRVIEAF